MIRLAPLFTVAALIALWASLISVFNLPSRLLPSPQSVAVRLVEGIGGGDMIPHILQTVLTSCLGFALGAVIAVALAASLDASRLAERMFYPLVSGIQSIPKVALAPVVLVWAGFGTKSIVILVALVSFYPIFVATFTGLKSVEPNLIALCRVSGASRLFEFIHIKLPAAAGHILTGFEIAIAFALVGSVVMEFIIGTGGAGFLIENAANSLDTPTAVASMVLLGILGACAGTLMRALRRRLVFWESDSATASSDIRGVAA